MAPPELLQVQPGELKFPLELKKQVSCLIQLRNTTEKNVAFKVKTTSPKKYCVRPNTGIVSPNSSFEVVVTMQAQRDPPLDMQCKDKFLVQSIVVPSGFSIEDFTQDTFNKESGNDVFETKLRVQYVQPAQSPSPLPDTAEEDLSLRPLQQNGEHGFLPHEPVADEAMELIAKLGEVRAAAVRLAEEKKAALQRVQQLQKEIEASIAMGISERGTSSETMKVQSGFSFLFVLLIGFLGIILGYLLRS